MRLRSSINRCCCERPGTDVTGQATFVLTPNLTASANAYIPPTGSFGKLIRGNLSSSASTIVVPEAMGSFAVSLRGDLSASANVTVLDAMGSFSTQLAGDLQATANSFPPPITGSFSVQLAGDLVASAITFPRVFGSLSKQMAGTLDASASATAYIPDSCVYLDAFNSLNLNWFFLTSLPWSVSAGRFHVPEPTATRTASRYITDFYPLLESLSMSVTIDPTEGGEFSLVFDLSPENRFSGRLRESVPGDPGAGPWRLEAYQDGIDGARSTLVAITDIPEPTGPGTLSVEFTRTSTQPGKGLYTVQWRWNTTLLWTQTGVELNWFGQATHGVSWSPGSMATGNPYIDNYAISGEPCLPSFGCTSCAGEKPTAYTMGFSGIVAADCETAPLYNSEVPLFEDGNATCLGWSTVLNGCAQYQPRAESYYEVLGNQDRQVVRIYSADPDYHDHEVFFETLPVPAGTLLCCEVFSLFLRSASPSVSSALGADWSNATCFVDPHCNEPPKGSGSMHVRPVLSAAASSNATPGTASGSYWDQLAGRLSASASRGAPGVSGFFSRQIAGNLSAVAAKITPVATGSFAEQLSGNLIASAIVSFPSATGMYVDQLAGNLTATASKISSTASGAFAKQLAGDLTAIATTITATATGAYRDQLSGNLTASATRMVNAASGSFSGQIAGDLAAIASVLTPGTVGTFSRQLAGNLTASAALHSVGEFSKNLAGNLTASANANLGYFAHFLRGNLTASADVDETNPGGGCAVCAYSQDWRAADAEAAQFDGVWQSNGITVGDWKVGPLRPDAEISPVSTVTFRRCVRPNFNNSDDFFEMESLSLSSSVTLSSSFLSETFEYGVYVLDADGGQISIGYGHDGGSFRAYINRPGRLANIFAPVSTLTTTISIQIIRELPPPNPRYGIVMRVGGVVVDSIGDLNLDWREQTEFGHIVTDGPNIGASYSSGFNNISISVSPCI